MFKVKSLRKSCNDSEEKQPYQVPIYDNSDEGLN